MPVKTIYIARHGFRLNWQTTIWKSPTGFPRDPPLAAYGNEQAEQLASHIASLPEDERPTAIYSSPYYRCLQTAKPTAKVLGLPIYVEHGLGEWYSPVKSGTGLHPRPVSAEELVSHFDLIDPSYTPTYLVTRKGESVPDLYKRAEDFLTAFISRVEASADNHERVMLFSHAATVIVLARGLLGDEAIGQNLRVGCCTLSTFDRIGSISSDQVIGAGIWQARGQLAHGDFLVKGIERDWGIADIKTINGEVIEDNGVPGTEDEKDIQYGVQPWDQEAKSVARM